jgi:hypothetical protein
MTQTELLQKVRARLGPKAYITHDAKAPRDPDVRRQHQDAAAARRNDIAGTVDRLKQQTRILQDADPIYQAMKNTLRQEQAALRADEQGARWRYEIRFTYAGLIFQMSRIVARGANAAAALQDLTDVLAANPELARTAKTQKEQSHE